MMSIPCLQLRSSAVYALLAIILALAGACDDRTRDDLLPEQSRQSPVVSVLPPSPVPSAKLERSPTAALVGDNLALGKAYTFSAPPNYQHCTEPNDARQLTDGYFAQGHFWTDRATVGWMRVSRVNIVVDLGAVQPIGVIAINTAGGRAAVAKAGVELPDAWFLVSDDGKTFRQVAQFHGYRMPDLPESYVRRYIAGDLAVSGRFIAVVLAANGPFIFLDEIEALRTSAAVRPHTGTLWTLKEFDEEVGRQRSQLTIQLAQERFAASRRAAVRANLLAATGDVPVDLATVDEERPWLKANAELASRRIPGQAVIAWSRDPWQDHSACELPPNAAASPRMDIVMGADEYESTAVALTNARDERMRIRAEMGDLIGPKGRIPSDHLSVRIGAFVDCRDGIQRPDALPLLDHEGAMIDPGCTRQLWLAVRTSGQPAGTYVGELVVLHSAGRIAVPVSVEVLPVSLPRPLPLAVVDWGYLSFAPCRADPDAAIRDRAAHYVNTAVLNAPDLPRFVVDGSGAVVSSDYKAFDIAIARYQSAGIGRFLFFSFFGDAGGTKRPFGTNVTSPAGLALGSVSWERALRDIILGWSRHCLELGIGYDRFAFYPWDEPHDRQLPDAAVIWKAIRKADPRIGCFVTTPGNAADALLRVADDISIWCPHLSRDKPISPESMAFYRGRQAIGQQVWLYNCQGPDKSFPPLAHYRRLSWQAWSYGMTGVGIWNYADTGSGRSTSAWTDLDGEREDYSLVYDAATAPDDVSRREIQIPSRRWEAFRDGIEDYAYLWALGQIVVEARKRGDDGIAKRAGAMIGDVEAAIRSTPDAVAGYSAAHARILRCLAELQGNR